MSDEANATTFEHWTRTPSANDRVWYEIHDPSKELIAAHQNGDQPHRHYDTQRKKWAYFLLLAQKPPNYEFRWLADADATGYEHQFVYPLTKLNNAIHDDKHNRPNSIEREWLAESGMHAFDVWYDDLAQFPAERAGIMKTIQEIEMHVRHGDLPCAVHILRSDHSLTIVNLSIKRRLLEALEQCMFHYPHLTHEETRLENQTKRHEPKSELDDDGEGDG